MNIKTAYSQSASILDAAQTFKDKFSGFDIRLLLVFASSQYDQNLLNQILQESFPETEIIGCSTAGELVTHHMMQDSIVVMAFNHKVISDIRVQVIPNLKTSCDLEPALNNFQDYFGVSLDQLDYQKYVGLLLIDGMAMMEEKLIEQLGDKSNLMIVGGSAGDDLKFEKTYVYANGQAYTNAAVLAIIKPQNGFEILKTQSFYPSDKVLIPTKVNPSTRTVLEFNHKPAALAYAKALGVTVEQLSENFMNHPLGLMAQGEPFVRSPQQVNGDWITFYCQVKANIPLTILNPLDIIDDTQSALQTKQLENNAIQGLIDFHCILRSLQLRQQNKTKEYIELFQNIPMIGFSTYGEAYLGHINQTSTMLIFK